MKNPTSAIRTVGGAAESSTLTQTSGDAEISLYVHVPFCQKKCGYCHFFVLPNQPQLKSSFTHALQREWEKRLRQIQGKNLASVYFGGGTPSLWGAQPLHSFMDKIRAVFPGAAPEVTLEVNPETVEASLLRAYRAAGVNRISMGVQSLDDSLLGMLTRTHSAAQAEEAVHLINAVGFSSISIDLMYDLPHQTAQQWEKTLCRAKELPIQHLSLYNLTFEPGTSFFKRQSQLQRHVPDHEESAEMFRMAQNVFCQAPWAQYEISAFSLAGHRSRHNTGYWTGRPFLGLGPSAFSFWEGKRFRNVAHLSRYAEILQKGGFPVDFEEHLLADAALRERLTIQLRLLEGVGLSQFQERWGDLDAETLQTIDALVGRGWLGKEGEHLALTSSGILFYDSLASELI